VTDITPAQLKKAGIGALLADLDNTLGRYGDALPSEEVRAWARSLGESGIGLALVSNNKSEERVELFAQALDAPFIARAGKPGEAGFLRAAGMLGREPGECAVMGDQIWADVLGARRAGMRAIYIEPVHLGNILYRLRNIIERPFICAGRRRGRRENL